MKLKTTYYFLALLSYGVAAGAFAQQQIAVTDISYKKEVREFFYHEAANSKSSVDAASSRSVDAASSSSLSAHDRSRVDASASITGAATNNAAYINERARVKGQNDVAVDAKSNSVYASRANSVYASRSQSSYVKDYGDKVRIEYTQLLGMSGEVRSSLIKAGFKLQQTRPQVARPGQTDQFFDIVGRIKNGEFAGSDYVLFGVVAAVENRSNREPIQGTSNFMNQYEMNLTVDYSLIDVKTLEAKAAFTVLAEGNDNRIDSPGAVYEPSAAKINAALSKSLSEQVMGKLAATGFVQLPPNMPIPANLVQPTYRDQPGSLKVY